MMPRLSTEMLAAQKVEGSYARQDAILAARRKMRERAGESVPHDAGLIERVLRDAEKKDRAAFDALISAIDAAPESNGTQAKMMKLVAKSALKKSFSQFCTVEAV